MRVILQAVLDGARVVVVIPARDEAERLPAVLVGLPPFVDHVVVVDDGSRDETAALVRAAADRDGRIELLAHATSRGVGSAIVSGYRRARALAPGGRDVYVVVAGDGQMHPDDMRSLVEPVARGEAGYAKGNRFVWPGARHVIPWQRRAGGELFSRLTGWAVGWPVTDSQCGYTALAGEVLRRVDLDGLWPGYGYPNDLLSRLTVAGVHVVQVPVRPIYAGEASGLRPHHLVRIMTLILRARVRRWRARDAAHVADRSSRPASPRRAVP